MIYLLLGGAVIALLIWTGRRSLPRLAKRDWRIAAGGLAALTFLGALLMGARGSPLIAGALAAAGIALALAARVSPANKAPRLKTSDAEARAILGVGPDATEAEINAAYSRLIRLAHPDKGGTTGLAAQLNAARDQLLKR
ncbi:DnaJ domain-containing protein [Caulobacter sp. SLTY]|uniref:J domain-containing protein n=1 Tax=Caulobacter sp. SLTY TaxID=2683262 RepID=UPI001412CB78|nr:DnaJ domain-containing protein [Caulobacter sp. SLTY]NBB14823.1 DnaJ domain-containing protein [Caulobacter sp. SLTY]